MSAPQTRDKGSKTNTQAQHSKDTAHRKIARISETNEPKHEEKKALQNEENKEKQKKRKKKEKKKEADNTSARKTYLLPMETRKSKSFRLKISPYRRCGKKGQKKV